MQIRRQLLFIVIAAGLLGFSWMVSPPLAVQSALTTNTPSPVPTNTPVVPTDTPVPTNTPVATDTPIPGVTPTNTPVNSTPAASASPTPVSATNTPGSPGSTNTPSPALGTPDTAQTPEPEATPAFIPSLGIGPDTSELMLFGIGLLGAVLLLVVGWWSLWKKSKS